jgi:hypothetical protein
MSDMRSTPTDLPRVMLAWRKCVDTNCALHNGKGSCRAAITVLGGAHLSLSRIGLIHALLRPGPVGQQGEAEVRVAAQTQVLR